ncbi:vanillate monooxygenase oxidoreductase subunit [Pseudomonas sp. PAGU 2196]|uniref:PDR/VanB family oxidoreductase n=1 Tax=Pseudomonas sp. PAGU 2196 TaxID=2793997 RepID=UPI001EDCB042|nr:PDR/VanB family oxidoreductase [Pseudomonas sp. PAGU 2196]GHS81872.1 vanillate monooxygenase oxidoreductase subunit [Pseudomonas sp. PAGU 2196]
MSGPLLTLKVHKRDLQGEDVVVLDLVEPQGRALPAFSAGAHVDVHLGAGLVRQYSLCSDPADLTRYRVGVLRDPRSRGGSAAVHALLQEGREVTIGQPRNLFPLAEAASGSLLFGGGIGITPMIAMAHQLHAQAQPFELHYCARSRKRSAFVQELEHAGFAACVHTHFDDETASGKLDLASVLGQAPAGVHVYVCGPSGFMDWVIGHAQAAGFAPDHIHSEYFQAAVETHGAAFDVVARRSGKTVRVSEGHSIARALAAAGVNIQVACEQGMCGTCLCTVLEGRPDHRDVYLTDEEKQANEQILTCCSRALSDTLVLDI